MTRRWNEHKKLFTEIKLCLVNTLHHIMAMYYNAFIHVLNKVDEVHIVGGVRGATLEACISRMKVNTLLH
jgi:hypothetical protein